MNLQISEELHHLIQQHAERAGMSAPAYVREAVARAAGWDLAIALFEERIAELEGRLAEQAQEIERLKAERSHND